VGDEDAYTTQPVVVSVCFNYGRHVFCGFCTDVSRRYIRVQEVDLQERTEEVEDNCVIIHTVSLLGPSTLTVGFIDLLQTQDLRKRCIV